MSVYPRLKTKASTAAIFTSFSFAWTTTEVTINQIDYQNYAKEEHAKGPQSIGQTAQFFDHGWGHAKKPVLRYPHGG